MAVTVIACATLGGQEALAVGPHHSFLGGPWELAVQVGRQGQSMRFPIEVTDEEKPENINKLLPIIGTPTGIRLNQYLPDLRWETTIVQDPCGGIVAELEVKGNNLQEQLWLSSDDPSRQSVTSSIGAVEIRRIHDVNAVRNLPAGPAGSKALGILSVTQGSEASPFEHLAEVGGTISMPKSEYSVTVLRYVPHYSMDTETKEVTSLSDKPTNPAILLRVQGDGQKYEQWLWAKFPSFTHTAKERPLSMRFTSFDLSVTQGRYFLVVSPRSGPWLLSSDNGRMRAEQAALDKPYPFANPEYYFTIKRIVDHAMVQTKWSNNSERLLHPAIIATVEEENQKKEVVLELDKPKHQRTQSGTMVLLYRRQQEPIKMHK
ncbi:MAG: hypothetical protein ACYSUC_06775 [Planctomycetota bacterium]